MKWKWCEDCYISGRCENQDRSQECNIYAKRVTDELAKVKQQLAIAVEALEQYADLYNWEDSDDYYACTYKYDFANKEAQEALQQIKELDK